MRKTSAPVDESDKKGAISRTPSFHIGLKRQEGERTRSPSLFSHKKMSVSRLRDWLFFTITGCVLYAAGLASPLLALPATLVFSLPTAILAYEHGAACALSSAFFSSASMAFALSGAFGLLYFCTFGLAGAIMGLIAKSGERGGNLLVAAGTVEFMGKLAGVLIFHYFYGVNLMAPGADAIEKTIMSFGNSPLDPVAARQVIDRVILLIPYGVIFFSVLEALFCLMLLSHFHRKRTGEAVYSLPHFRDWRFPRSILVALAAGFICGQISSEREGFYLLKQMGANLNELSRTVFILQGLSCAYFFMERKGIPMAFRAIAIIITPIAPFFGDLFAIAGVVDMGFDFRKKQRGV
jgi:uncharacterized protein YybS (DUF2232 family)